MSSTGAAPAATTAHQGIAFTAGSFLRPPPWLHSPPSIRLRPAGRGDVRKRQDGLERLAVFKFERASGKSSDCLLVGDVRLGDLALPLLPAQVHQLTVLDQELVGQGDE